MGLGIARLRFDVDILNLLPANLSVAQGLQLYQKHFANSGELIITLQAPTAEEAESAAHSLANLLRQQTNLVAAVTWQPAWMEEPAQAMELVAYLWLNQPPVVFAELTDRLASTNLTKTLNETRDRLTTSLSPNDIGLGGYDPYGLTRLPESVSAVAQDMGTGDELFTSQDGTFRLVFVAGEARPFRLQGVPGVAYTTAAHNCGGATLRPGPVYSRTALHWPPGLCRRDLKEHGK